MIINASKDLSIVDYAKKLPEDHIAREQLNRMFELLDVVYSPLMHKISFDDYEKEVKEFMDQFAKKSDIITDIKPSMETVGEKLRFISGIEPRKIDIKKVN